MTSTASSVALRLHLLSFVWDEKLHQWQFWAKPEEAQQLDRLLNQHRPTLDRSMGGRLQDLQVMPIEDEPGSFNSPIGALSDVAWAWTHTDDPDSSEAEHLSEACRSQWKQTLAAAEALEQALEQARPEHTEGYDLDFVWDNGGGDDNGYGDRFLSFGPQASAEQKALAAAFETQFERWVEWFGYDISLTPWHHTSAQRRDGIDALLVALAQSAPEEATAMHQWLSPVWAWHNARQSEAGVHAAIDAATPAAGPRRKARL